MRKYISLEMEIIHLNPSDCLTSSIQDFKDYEDNELPLVPFGDEWR